MQFGGKCVIFLILWLTTIIGNAQNFDKYIEKYQKYFDKGDYDKAYKINDKLIKKSTKKLGASNKYVPLAYLNSAKLQLQSGIITDIESSLRQSIQTSAENTGPESVDHAKLLLEATYLSVKYGNYALADSALQQAVEIFKATDRWTDDLKAESLILDLKIKVNRGYYLETIQEFLENMGFLRSRAESDEGKKAEREFRTKQLAQAINDAAAAFILRGSIQQADSTLKTNEEWFHKNLNNKDDENVENELLFGHLYELLDDDKTAEKYFENAFSHAKSGRKDFDPLVLDVQQQLIGAYYQFDKAKQAEKEIDQFKKVIKDNFPAKSFQHVKGFYLDLQDKFLQHDYDAAITLALNIVNNQTILPEYHQIKILANEKLYKIYQYYQNYPAAESTLENILKAKGHLYGDSTPVYHLSLLQDAGYQIEFANNLDKIDSIVKFSWEKTVKNEIDVGHEDFIDIENNLAAYYNLADKFDKSREALDAALTAVVKKYQDRHDARYAKELMQIANLQIDLGQFDRAKKYLDLALSILWDIRKENDNLCSYANGLNMTAKLYTIQGMYDEAEDALKKSHKLLKKNDLLVKGTMPVEEITAINIKLGRFSDSEKLLEDEIGRIEKNYSPVNKALINPLNVLGKLKFTLGDYNEAEKLANRAFDIAQSVYGKESTRLVAPLSLLADISNNFGDHEKAEKYLNRAIEIQRSKLGDDHIQLASLYTKLGLVMLQREGDPAAIRKLFAEAKDIYVYTLDDQNPLYADMLKNLAYVDIQEKKYNQAFQLLLQAEQIWNNKVGSRNNINAAEIYVLQGDIYYMLSNYDEAKSNYNRASTLYTKFFTHNHPNYVKVQAKLSRVAYMQGDTKEAMSLIEQVIENYNNFIKVFFPSLSEREKAKFWNKIKEDYEYYNTIVLKQIDAPDDKLVGKLYNNALKTKALLLDTSIKMRENILNSKDSSLIALYHDWLLSKDQLTQMLSMSLAQLDEDYINVDSLKTHIENLEKELSQRSELFSKSQKNNTITWEQVKSSLQENEAAVEMVRFRYFDKILTDSVVYAAFILKSDRKRDRPEVLLLKNGRQLENKYFKYYKNMILFQMKDDQSYNQFWKPIAQALGENRTIYFSADGIYTQINLETLMTDDDHYVLDNSNIILVSNTKDLLTKKSPDGQDEDKRALIMGDPQFYVSIKPDLSPGHEVIQRLPGTEREVESLTKLLTDHGWKIDHFMKVDASEAQVKKLENPEVFHIATHGFYKPEEEISEYLDVVKPEEASEMANPLMRSGLLLKGAGDILTETKYNYNIENGILTAYEAMNLNLDHTKLVVLSACETGVGDVTVGEGVYGLQRAFLVAGAKVLIMSMFKINDMTTDELMVTFYRRWLESGKLRESFVEAKKEIRNKYHDPIYWGSFVMIGLE